MLTYASKSGINILQADSCGAGMESGILKKPIPITQGNQALMARIYLLDRTLGHQVMIAHLEIMGFSQTLFCSTRRTLPVSQ